MDKKLKALIILAGFLIVSGSPADAGEVRTATIDDMKGEVLVRLAGTDWQAAKEDMVLHEKDEIRTLAGAKATLLLDEGKTGKLELREKSFFRLNTLKKDDQTDKKTTLLDLAEGKLRVYAKKLKDGEKFEVRTPTAIAGVRGTVFDVSVDEKK